MISLPFSKKSGLLYIGRNKAQLYILGSSSSVEVVFDTAVFENLEVKDQGAFRASIKDVIQKIPEKDVSLLIVLSVDILFRKDFQKQSEDQLNQEIGQFIDAIPIDNEKLDYRRLQLESGVAVVATNSLIYNIARDAAESFGWSVSAIVPAAFFGVTTADISISVLSQITKAKFSFGQSDFLREGVHGKVTVNPVVELNKSKSVSSITSLSQPSSNITAVSSIASISNSSNKKSILLLVLALIFFGFAGFIVKQYYFPAQVVKKVEAPVPAKEEEVIEVPVVETPAVEEVPSIDRSIFKIRVLNSTSIKGLASKVQKAFITAGFTIATAGNSTDVLTSTEVALYRKVSKADEDEIRSILVEALGVNDINFVNYFDEEKGSGYTYGTVNDDAVVTIAGVK